MLYAYFATFWGVKSDILDAKDTVEKIQKGKSLIRLGDGEFGMYLGKDIHYQTWSASLLEDFQKIQKDYEEDPESCPYLLAVPKRFMQCSGFFLAQKWVYVSCWAQSRYLFQKKFRRENISYGDAFLFEKKNSDIYRNLWQGPLSPEHIIFVHNHEKYAENFATTYGKSVAFVPIPKKNAYAKLDEIYQNVLAALPQQGEEQKKAQVVISAGPAGKVLVYRLSRLGIHCVDAGHCWDDPLDS